MAQETFYRQSFIDKILARDKVLTVTDPLTDGAVVNHGRGTALGLAANQFDLDVTFKTATGALVTGIDYTITTADTITLTFDGSITELTAFTGKIRFRADPKA